MASNVVTVKVGSPEQAVALRADTEEILARVNRSLEREPLAKAPVDLERLLMRLDQWIDLHLLALPATAELLALAPDLKAAARASVLKQVGARQG